MCLALFNELMKIAKYAKHQSFLWNDKNYFNFVYRRDVPMEQNELFDFNFFCYRRDVPDGTKGTI
jgi:hypothetical protein